jgi:hypothetical protein
MQDRVGNLAQTLRIALLPVSGFALANAAICWFAARIFWERYEFSATCFGLGCGGIVIALCSYLYVLTNEMRKWR